MKFKTFSIVCIKTISLKVVVYLWWIFFVPCAKAFQLYTLIHYVLLRIDFEVADTQTEFKT